ncbi:MAG: DUF5667 domain-containing protein, partial [Chloroflexota bacterium]
MTEHHSDAERLARRLDQALPPGETRVPQQSNDPRVNAAILLARTRPPSLSPETDQRILGLVMAAHRGHFSDNGARLTLRRRSPVVLRGLLAACLVVVLLVAGLLPVSAASVPGDLFYPVKQALERVELALAMTDAAQAQAHLRHASRRIAEARILLDRGQFDAGVVNAALNSLRVSARKARASGDPGLIDEVQAQTVIVASEFTGLLQQASARGVSTADLQPVAKSLQMAVSDGTLLLPAPPEPTSPPTHTPGPTSQPQAGEPGQQDQPPIAAGSDCAPGDSCQPDSTATPTLSPTGEGASRQSGAGGGADTPTPPGQQGNPSGNPNAGPGNNSGSPPGSNSGQGNSGNPNAGPGNNSGSPLGSNSGQGNSGNPNAGPGN